MAAVELAVAGDARRASAASTRTDNTDRVQTGQVHKPLPDGATDRHTIEVTVA
jgi:hypothetical protein